ncbi:hypothetical protein HDU93_005069, partial [Gonapodya sp. JEL0774]
SVRVDGSKKDDTFVRIVLRPNLDIVEQLLRHNAVVTESELEHARRMQDIRYLETFQKHLAKLNNGQQLPSLPRLGSAVASSTPTSRPPSPLQAAMEVAGLPHIDELSLRLALFESKVTSLERQLAEVTSQNSALKATQEALRAQNEAHLSKIGTLEAEMAALRNVPSAGVEHARGTAHMEHLSRTPTLQNPHHTRIINALMCVVSEFHARAADEITLSVGDEVFLETAFEDGWGT